MLKNLLHLTLLSYLWKRYKTLILSILLLMLYFWLVGKVHQDYVSYSELNEDHQYLALSFIIKWIAFAIGAIVFLLFNTLSPLRDRPAAPEKKKPAPGASAKSPKREAIDPFEQIRHKDTLRSRADFILEKQQQLPDNTDKGHP